MIWDFGRDILKMDVGDGKILKLLKYLILGVGKLYAVNDIGFFIRNPLDCDALAVKDTVSILNGFEEGSKGHGVFRGQGSCGQQTNEQAKAEQYCKHSLFHGKTPKNNIFAVKWHHLPLLFSSDEEIFYIIA